MRLLNTTPFRYEIILVITYLSCLFLYFVIQIANQSRIDHSVILIWFVYGFIIIGFSYIQLKKWIYSMHIENELFFFKKFWGLQVLEPIPANQLIVVKTIKNNKTLYRVFDKYCKFIGQFYLLTDNPKELDHLFREKSFDYVE